EVRHRGHDADGEITEPAERRDDLWQPEADPVDPGHEREVEEAAEPDASVRERLEEAVSLVRRAPMVLVAHVFREPCALRRLEPARVLRSFGQVDEDDGAEGDRRNALAEEEPLPARETGRAAEAE